MPELLPFQKEGVAFALDREASLIVDPLSCEREDPVALDFLGDFPDAYYVFSQNRGF